MLNLWGNQKFSAGTIVANESYDIEGNGHLYAIQEAFDDVAEVETMFANVEAHAVDAVVAGGVAALESFSATPVVENMFKNIWDKIIASLKSLWEKIKGVWKSARQYFDAMFMSAKNFATKYEDALGNIDLSKFKYEMFEYTINVSELSGLFGKISGFADVKLDGKKNKADTRSVTRDCMNAIVSGATNSDAFERGLFKKLRNGKDSKREISPNVSDFIKHLKDDEGKDLVKTAESETDELIKEALETIEDARKKTEEVPENETAEKKTERLNNIENGKLKYKYTVEAKSIIVKVFNAYKQAMTERDSAYKSCISAALHYKPE